MPIPIEAAAIPTNNTIKPSSIPFISGIVLKSIFTIYLLFNVFYLYIFCFTNRFCVRTCINFNINIAIISLEL